MILLTKGLRLSEKGGNYVLFVLLIIVDTFQLPENQGKHGQKYNDQIFTQGDHKITMQRKQQQQIRKLEREKNGESTSRPQ